MRIKKLLHKPAAGRPGIAFRLAIGQPGVRKMGRSMRGATGFGLGWCAVIGLAASLLAQAPPLYQNDFSKAELDQAPADFLVIDGQFSVKQDGDNRFLELPGAPLETFGLLFGPTGKDGLAVGARIFGTSTGRRFPTFGVSLNGVSGYKLQVAPARKSLELWKGDRVLTSVPFGWESGRWTHLKLQVRKAQDGWEVSGKVWAQSAAEPEAWTISHVEKDEPSAGRPGIWGSPFSGTPVRYDDLQVTWATEKR
jgi:hypothetical protein